MSDSEQRVSPGVNLYRSCTRKTPFTFAKTSCCRRNICVLVILEIAKVPLRQALRPELKAYLYHSISFSAHYGRSHGFRHCSFKGVLYFCFLFFFFLPIHRFFSVICTSYTIRTPLNTAVRRKTLR